MGSSAAIPSKQSTPAIPRQTVPWVLFGYALIAGLLLFRLAYLASLTRMDALAIGTFLLEKPGSDDARLQRVATELLAVSDRQPS